MSIHVALHHRTTYRYDLARKNLDRHANHTLAAYLAVGA